ncbi:MAG TPA: DUF2314 domain-containing protein [Steroidobacteraceae bacterium]|nr:DUF2314 domain-containing protein [Steroidobacteraceae bacterium]
MKRELAWMLVVAVLAGCGDGNGEVIEREGQPPVSMVGDDDPEMNTAIHKAQVSLDEFERRLTDPPPKQTYISLKGRFERGGVVEHIWLNQVRVVPEGYRGNIGNEPLNIPDLRYGQEVLLPREDVSDWLAIEDDHLIAGYSVRLLRSRLTPAERVQFDAQSKFTIDD